MGLLGFFSSGSLRGVKEKHLFSEIRIGHHWEHLKDINIIHTFPEKLPTLHTVPRYILRERNRYGQHN